MCIAMYSLVMNLDFLITFILIFSFQVYNLPIALDTDPVYGHM